MWSQTLKVQISDKTAAVRASANFRLPPSHSSFPFLSPPFVISFFTPSHFSSRFHPRNGLEEYGMVVLYGRGVAYSFYTGVVVVIRFSQLFEGKKLSEVFEDSDKLYTK